MSREVIGVVAGKSGEAITKEVKKWGVEVALVAGKNNEPGIELADYYLCEDLSNKDQIYAFFCEKNVKKVIFGTGHVLAIELAEFIYNKGLLINIKPEVSFLCNNKFELKKVAEKIGLKTPKYELLNRNDKLDNILSNWEFPLVVKSIKDIVTPRLVHGREELQKYLNELFQSEPTVMIEQYIKGNDCSVVVSNSGVEVKAVGVLYWSKAKEDKLEGFFESFSKTLDKVSEEKVRTVAVKLIEYVNVLGLPRVDIIVADNTPYILEVNSIIFSKSSGTLYTISSRRKGINSAKIIVKNAMEYFSKKAGCKYKKKESILLFCDQDVEFKNREYEYEIIKDVNSNAVIPENYLYPDVVEDITIFLSVENEELLVKEKRLLEKYISCMNIVNPDYVENRYKGREKVIVDLAVKYLNLKQISYGDMIETEEK